MSDRSASALLGWGLPVWPWSPRLHFASDDRSMVITHGRAAGGPTLRLTVEGLVAAVGSRALLCSWDDYDTGANDTAGPSGPGWFITYAWAPNGARQSVALWVTGAAGERDAWLLQPSFVPSDLRLRGYRAFPSYSTGVGLPITGVNTARPFRRQRALLNALSLLFHNEPDRRALLAEPAIAQRFAVDLDQCRLGRPRHRFAFGQDGVDIEAAMVALGYVHAYGRPVGSKPLPDLASITMAVAERLDTNPYRAHRQVAESRLHAVIKHLYLDITPWPFDALARH